MQLMRGAEGLITANLIVSAISYGMHIMTFLAVAYLSLRNKKHCNEIPSWVLVPVYVLLVLGTVDFIGSTAFYFKSWRHGYAAGGGPIDWIRENYTDKTSLVARASFSAAYLVQDIVVLRRVYIVYSMCRFRAIAVAVSSIVIFGVFVFSVIPLANEAWPAGTRWLQNIGPIGTVHCSFAAGMSITLTIAVVVRMLCYRRWVIKTLGREHAGVYTSAVAVFVESNALFSILTIACAIPGTHFLGRDYLSFASSAVTHAAGVSTGLLAIRAAFGKAWVETTASFSVEPIQFSTDSRATHTLQSRV